MTLFLTSQCQKPEGLKPLFLFGVHGSEPQKIAEWPGPTTHKFGPLRIFNPEALSVWIPLCI